MRMRNTAQKRKVSELFHLEPMNVFSGSVESLSSYISRLSQAHCLPVDSLVTEIIWPEINLSSKEANKSTFYEMTSKSINGVGIYAREFTVALQRLTLRQELRYLTMLPFESFIDRGGKGLIKEKKEWCPQCYEEQTREYGFMYDPLRWSILQVSTCDKHKSKLSSVCHVCKREQWSLVRYTPLGYCIHCGANLSESCVEIQHEHSSPEAKEWTEWLQRNINKLLQASEILDKECSSESFSMAITKVVDDLSDGKASHLDKTLGFGVGTIAQWRRGRYKPRFDYLLHMAYRLGVDVLDLVQYKSDCTQKVLIRKDHLSIKAKDNREHKTYDHDKIERRLDIVIKKKIPMSVNAIANELGVSYGYLNHRFTDKVREISDNYKRQLKEERRRKFNDIADHVRMTIREFHNQDIYPSRRKVFLHAFGADANRIARHSLRNVWRDEMINLGYLPK